MHTWIKQLKVLAWDLDGTLYPSTPPLNRAIDEAIVSALAAARATSLQDARHYYETTKATLKSSTKVLNSVGIDGQKFFIDLWNTLPLERYIAPNNELAALFTQPLPLQHYLHTNSNTPTIVARKLACLGIAVNSFTQIMTFPIQGIQKPDAAAFDLLIERAGCQPQEILYLGDRAEVDLVPAHSRGLYTALIGDSLAKREALQQQFGIDLGFEDAALALRFISAALEA